MLANHWWQTMSETWDEKLFNVDIVSVDGKPVKGGAGMVVHPSGSTADVDDADLILIPPFLPNIRWLRSEYGEAITWLQEQHQAGRVIAAMCTGTFLLAQTGLLDGRAATTNWRFARSFRKHFPEVNLQLDRTVTEQEGLFCSGAATAYLDLLLRLIAHFGSEELANNCSKSLLLDANRGSQAPYIIFDRYRNHNDDKVVEAQKWLEEHYTELVMIDDVAKMLSVSPRHFQRRFKEATGESPLTYLQKIRVEIAKEKLETTKDSFGEITWHVGYEDVNSFRKLFMKHTDLSPSTYRMKFARPV